MVGLRLVEIVMKDCVFCKIASGEFASFKIYEDKNILAFLDIAPLSKGHTLIIPKNHVQWVHLLDATSKIWEVSHRIAKSVVANLGYDHVNFITLGYEVPHAHVHVIPRNPGDDLTNHIDWTKRKKFSEQEMKQVQEKISL